MRIERSKNPDFITNSKVILKTKETQNQKQDSKLDFKIEPIKTNHPDDLKKKPVSKYRVVRILEENGIFNSVLIFAIITLVLYILELRFKSPPIKKCPFTSSQEVTSTS